MPQTFEKKPKMFEYLVEQPSPPDKPSPRNPWKKNLFSPFFEERFLAAFKATLITLKSQQQHDYENEK